MKVGVLCEESGVVRDAFAARGHDAWSCDILPRPGKHLRGDARDFDWSGFDIVIVHPPCTYLTTRGRYRATDKQKREAESFFLWTVDLDVPRLAVENPKGITSSIFRKPDQIIHPWQFGHTERKATCLWLKGLAPLVPTKTVEPEAPVHIDSTTGKRRYSLDYLPGNLDRGRIRSKTFPGIAAAMADQWGGQATGGAT